MPKIIIPVSQPVISKNSGIYVDSCIKSNWISSHGPYVDNFEKKFADYLGVKHATTTTSGTTALHLALVALGIKAGDEVIIPTFTMIAPAFAILYVKAKPVLVDADPKTWNMNVMEIEKKINSKTKAIIAVHIYGHPVDMDPLIKLCKHYNLLLIEDAAEGLGATYKQKKLGSFGKAACFSFYANKLVTTGEGGMVVTNDSKLFERMKRLKDMAHSSYRRFLHTEIGFNYRMTNMQAALGLATLEEIDKSVKKKRDIAKQYSILLAGIPHLTLPIEKNWARSVYWMYAILVNKAGKISKLILQKKLRGEGIETRDFFVPMHRQPALLKLGLFSAENYPVAEEISNTGLYLPSGNNLRKNQIEQVVKTIKKIYGSL